MSHLHAARTVLRTLTFAAFVVAALHFAPAVRTAIAQGAAPRGATARIPTAKLSVAGTLTLPGVVDSNSPVVWEIINGRRMMVVFTSAGEPTRSAGASLRTLSSPRAIRIVPAPGEGVWMESIIRNEDGTWYGFYHNERRALVCGETGLVSPRIGAARSDDFGRTWTDLGILIEAPPSTFVCETPNTYFVGGVGDLIAIRDPDAKYVYVYFSQYGPDLASQGIAVGRFLWADRDAPVGKIDIWSSGVWAPGRVLSDDEGTQLVSGTDDSGARWDLPPPASIFPTSQPWHGSNQADSFWGPSIHWNTYLEQYVMLVNRAADETFAQDGIYVSFNPSIDNPTGWSPPTRLLSGGLWYPQVIGDEIGGTDKTAGQVARLFVGGQSRHQIRFDR